MKMKKVRSRIHQFITPALMTDLEKVCNNVIVSDNNLKSMKIKQLLDKHDVYYNELGPGTNRMAVLIDGYVFKFAMDKWGKQDNANEFAMSKELQPFVIKVYECNDLISVSEYVTLITREEFRQKKFPILKILSTLSESYLIGDVGYVEKNFTNWGYRDNNELVILDFAYIHNIEGTELFCQKDGQMIEYDSNFYRLKCPQCNTVYSFIEIRKKISIEEEWEFINEMKNHSYILDTSEMLIKDETEQNNNVDTTKEETVMNEETQEFDQEVINESYSNALARMRAKNLKVKTDDPCEDSIPQPDIVDNENSYIPDGEEEEGKDFYQMMKEANPDANLTAPYERDIDEETDTDSMVTITRAEKEFNLSNVTPSDLMELVDEVCAHNPDIGEVIPRNTNQVSTVDLTVKVETTTQEVTTQTTEEITISTNNSEPKEAVVVEVKEEEKEKPQAEAQLPEPPPANESKTFNPAELMARAHRQHAANNTSSTIRVTRPTPTETEQEKYERLARENGHNVD